METLKKSAVFAAIALAAMSGIFAQAESSQTKLPDEKMVKEYHEGQLAAFKALADSQVKAQIISQEWADARIANLKAVQADCKGECILQGRTDIPFGTPRPRFYAAGPAHRHCGNRFDFAPNECAPENFDRHHKDFHHRY